MVFRGGHLRKFFKTFFCTLSALSIIIGTSGTTYALSDYWRTMFSENNIIFYDPEESGADCITAAGIVSGEDNAAKIWNYFATANIPGVSDNAAVIAGIMGNLQQESGLNPFSHTSGSSYYGIFQSNNSSLFKDAIDGNGWSSYWGKSISEVPTDVNDTALKLELDALVSWDRFSTFTNNLDWVNNKSGTDGARSYAELFLVEVERAVNGNSPLQDSKVQSYVNTKLYPNQTQYHNKPYQGTSGRRDNAATFYTRFANASGTASVTPGAVSSSESSSSSSDSSISWDGNGWINGIPGMTKYDVTGKTDLNETILGKSYLNGKPNKILLHSTEGTTNGYNAYPANNKYPAHFIVDLKKKEGYQNIPLSLPAVATKAADKTTVQIEIVGFSGNGSGEYYLQNFSDEDWDYLAVLLGAIASYTGIPLSSSVDWSDTSHSMSQDAFNNLSGVVGYRHAPSPDNHTDPGNIWGFVEAAINRNPDAAKFNTGRSSGNAACYSSGGNLVSGGMTKEEADAFMEIYRAISPRNVSENSQLSAWGITATQSCTSDMENCVAFSKYFLNRYTSISTSSVGNGGQVVSNLSKNFGLPTGTKPQPYAIFSVSSGSTMCGNAPCGHTGVVLGVDEENDKIIVGEAGCGASYDWTGAHEYSLSKYTDGSYTYAYTDNVLNL